MYRYYKISQQWAERLGETDRAVRHPDGMYLVLPNLGPRIAAALREDNPDSCLLPEEAFDAIGAIGLTVEDAHRSAAGELRHDEESSQPPEGTAEDTVDSAAKGIYL